MFTDTKLVEIKQQLLGLQKALRELEDTGNDAASIVELDQSRVGRLSRMDALQGQAMSLETKRRREIELQNISSALRRITNGDYGYCVRCGEQIAIKRLEHNPAAPLCVDCASSSEL